MGTLHTLSAPPPGLSARGDALDLRIAIDPAAATPVSVALLGRVWGTDAPEVSARAERLCAQVHAAVPRHVTAAVVQDGASVAGLLAPFPDGTAVDSAVITRHELFGLPSRPDAQVSYYFSAVPFNWSDQDWSPVYSTLMASPVPLVVSVAVLPVQIPATFGQTLLDMASFYGRLAREDQMDGGLYYGRQKLAPDAFAIDAERAFRDFSRRLAQKAFVIRIQVTASGQLPPGVVETVAAAISPAETTSGTHLERERSVSAYEVRRPATQAQRQATDNNLRTIDFGLLPGRPQIWSRPDPPDAQLQMLSVIGDAKDACCAFRLPVAVDGTVPGFRVRRGQFGHAEAYQASGPAIRIGRVSGSSRQVMLPVRSLTKHALLAGSTGSGKTTTAMEILRQLWLDHRTPFMVIEPVNSDADDYRRLAAEPGFESLEVITRTLTATAAPPGLVLPTAAAPFGACESCRARCAYRGAAMAMVNDPRTVSRIRDAVAALEASGLTATEIESRWSDLIDRLYTEVGAFAALPSADPGRADAAFCLFLHSLAIRTMRFSTAWPLAVAARLGITTNEVPV
jgi:Helicase HerA, central domain